MSSHVYQIILFGASGFRDRRTPIGRHKYRLITYVRTSRACPEDETNCLENQTSPTTLLYPFAYACGACCNILIFEPYNVHTHAQP